MTKRQLTLIWTLMGVDHIHRSIKKRPYRPYRYAERDTIPIHHQPFPLYQPLLAEHALFIREELDFDDATEGTSHPTATKSHKIGVLGGPSYERETSQNVKGTVESMMRHRVTVPERQEHKIRNLDVIIGHFVSLGDIPLEHPPICSQAVHGDLYVHHYENQLQIWLRDGDQWVPDIRDRYHHPTLPEYRLNSKKSDNDNVRMKVDIGTPAGRMLCTMSFVLMSGIFKGAVLQPEGPHKFPHQSSSISIMLKQVTLKITLKNEHDGTTVDSPHGGCACLLAQLESVQQKLVDANPEERDKEHAATRDKATKPIQKQFFPSDILLITVLMLLLMLVSLDIWSHFIVVHD
ncbi:hypothetical protein EDD17DRAFT_1504851 [Pisolithus thermaeus]|nr:hypothetical protein EDD17DRAFT_1504851 [Pisolithus thermaeus]